MTLLLLAAGLALLVGGAEALVRGASGLALRAGISPLVVGLTVVSFGTSFPELSVSVSSALAGRGAVALGNVIGSNIFNIAVILGVAALICPLSINVQLIRWDVPVMLTSSLLFTGLAATGGGVGRGEGLLLFTGLVAYTVWTVVLGRRQALPVGEAAPAPPRAARSPGLHLFFVVAGLAMLTGGAALFVDQSVLLATRLGVSEAVIGLTIVAAGTSLPEWVTSVSAALHGKADLAVGNVVGSNTFNVLCIGGGAAIFHPLDAAGIRPFDLAWMIGLSILLLPLMLTRFRLVRWEGALLLAGYLGYLALLWPPPS